MPVCDGYDHRQGASHGKRGGFDVAVPRLRINFVRSTRQARLAATPVSRDRYSAPLRRLRCPRNTDPTRAATRGLCRRR